MSAPKSSSSSSGGTVSVRASEDGQRLYCGGPHGISIYRLRPCHMLTHVRTHGGIGLAVGLGCTSLVAATGASRAAAFSSRSVVIFNVATAPPSPVVELRFDAAVLNVFVSVQRLVVVLRQRIHVYDLSTAAHLATLETADNPLGVAAMSPDVTSPFLVFPKPDSKSGELLVYDVQALNVKSLIEAHRAPVACICMSACGTRVATASSKGTMIRVFSLPSGSVMQTFRRGTTPARVLAMSFFSVPLRPDLPGAFSDEGPSSSFSSGRNWTSGASITFDEPLVVSAGGAASCLTPSFLVVGSTMPTVHIFKLKDAPRVPPFLLVSRSAAGPFVAGAQGRSRHGSFDDDEHEGASPSSAPVAFVSVSSRAPDGVGAERATPTAAASSGTTAGSLASAMASAAGAAFSAAIGLEGERDFATIKLASVYEAYGGRPSESGADPHAAADPPISVCITPAWYHVLPPSGSPRRARRSEPDVVHTRSGSAVYSIEADSEDDGSAAESRESAEEDDEDYEVVGVSLVPPGKADGNRGQPSGNAPRGNAALGATSGSAHSLSRSAADVVRTALAHKTIPPPYVINVVTQGGRVLQYGFDPETGGACEFLGDTELPMPESADETPVAASPGSSVSQLPVGAAVTAPITRADAV